MEFVGTFYVDGTCKIAMWDVDEDIDGGAATDTDKDDSQDPRPDLRGGEREEQGNCKQELTIQIEWRRI